VITKCRFEIAMDARDKTLNLSKPDKTFDFHHSKSGKSDQEQVASDTKKIVSVSDNKVVNKNTGPISENKDKSSEQKNEKDESRDEFDFEDMNLIE